MTATADRHEKSRQNHVNPRLRMGTMLNISYKLYFVGPSTSFHPLLRHHDQHSNHHGVILCAKDKKNSTLGCVTFMVYRFSMIHTPGAKPIELEARASQDLIRYIVPAPRCRLVVSRASLRGLDDVELANLAQVYSTFIRSIANFQAVQHISLSYTEDGIFSFRAAGDPLQFNSPYPYLNFSYGTSSQQDPSILDASSVSILKALATRPDLGHVTKLDLKLDGATYASSRIELIAFLRQLESVSGLTTDLTMLRHLADAQAVIAFSILPSTTTVIVTDITFNERLRSPMEYLDPFLKGRMARGIPVRILNLSKDDFSEDGRWNFLTEIQGLSVVWSRRFFGMEDDETELSDE